MTSTVMRVLVVGAGGIGCELLKDLVLEGFNDITVIDLDTIDISNLNRQFLFHRRHVGKSKAEVARESVMNFRPDVNVVAYHKSIFSQQFNVEFFADFDLVFNALDNQAARRHVNRLCFSAKRPLIESGTAGYLGQVEPLLPFGISDASAPTPSTDDQPPSFQTGCYECQPRSGTQRTYPACTIRNTPSEPIHCVVWAKYLFNQLFGEPDVDEEDVSPDSTDPELLSSLRKNGDVSGNHPLPDVPNDTANGHDNSTKQSGAATVAGGGSESLHTWFQTQWSSNHPSNGENGQISQSVSAVAKAVAWRLFHNDLVTLVGMRDLWEDRQDRREPSPLDEATLNKAVATESGLFAPEESVQDSGVGALRDQRCLAPAGWLRLMMESTDALQRRIESSSSASGTTSTLTWDKDDTDSLNFVTGAAILRAQLFHLPAADSLNRFTVKSLAGNIVPAIATTNAIIAGLMVLQARHVLSRRTKHIRSVFLHRHPTGRRGHRRLVVPCDPAGSNPKCLVCGTDTLRSQLSLVCDPATLTLRVIRDRILIGHLGMLAPDVELEDRGVILISSEEGETDENTLDKTLADFNVFGGCRLQCDDFRQDFNLRLLISPITPELQHALEDSSNGDQDKSSTESADKQWHLVGDLNSVLTEARTNANHHEQPQPSTTTGEASPLVVLDDTAEIEDDRAPQAALRQQTSKRRRTLDPENADIHSPKRSRSTDAPEAEADEDEVQFIANCPSAIAAVAVANKDDDQNDANDLIMLD